MRPAHLAIPFVILMPAAAAASPAGSAALLPHRAVYDLELENASDRSGITGINGRMVYEFNGSACDGYTVTFRFVTQIDTAENSQVTDQQTTTYEDGEGENFNFVTRSFVNQKLDSELKGKATLSPEATTVSLEKPDPKELKLDATQFPTQHLIELLDKAGSGERFYETTLYDGSDKADKIMTTTVIIGNEAPAETADPEFKAIEPLEKDSFWPVDIAYFDMQEGVGEELPTYRISFKLHESGITRDLIMDYGDFSMKGTLVDLSMFDPAPAESCAQ